MPAGECKLGAVAACTTGCDQGKLEQCVTLGRSYQMGEPKGDREKAIATFLKACKAGHAPACEPLAEMLDNKYFEDTYNRGTATSQFKQACGGGVESACVTYILRDYETDSGKAQAFKQFEERCKQGKLLACTYVGWMYGAGHHVQKDEARAAKLYAESCDKSEPVACAKLAMATKFGWGVEKDEAKAEKLATKSCDLGCTEGCADLARSTEVERTKRGVDLRKRACDLYDWLGCSLLARDYENGIEGVLPKNPELALKHFNQACLLGSDSSCVEGNRVLLELSKK